MAELIERKKFSTKKEMDLIIGMIVSDEFLSGVAPIFEHKFLLSSANRTIARWAIEYYERYQKAPKETIQEIFAYKQKDSRMSDVEVESIEKVLTNLSSVFESMENYNWTFFLDQSEKYLAERKLSLLTLEIEELVSSGKIADAEHAVASHNRVKRPSSESFDVICDEEEIKNVLTQTESQVLLSLSGFLGTMIGDLCRGDFLSFLAPMKRGKCLKYDSVITLADGTCRKIEDIVKNKTGACIAMDSEFKLHPQKISAFYDNGIKDIFEVTTKTGRTIEITSNHPLYDFSKKWTTIDEGLSVGDFIAVPKNIPIFGKKEIPLSHVKLIAYLLADGGFTGNSITFSKQDSEIKKEFREIISELGDSITVQDSITDAVVKGYTGNAKTKTKNLLIDYGVKFSKSIEKEIPQCIFTLPKNQLQIFLNRLFSCDGSVFPAGIEYSSGSKVLIRQVHHLLLRFGIISKLNRSFVNGIPYYRIAINDAHYVTRFVEEIGFFSIKQERALKYIAKWKVKAKRSFLDGIPAPARKILIQKIKESGIKNNVFNTITEVDSWINNDIMFDEIIKIEYTGKHQTYDITVPQFHNFIANDIIAHNTWWMMHFAKLCAIRGLKVLFISLEMPKHQMLFRFYQSLAGETKRACETNIPFFDGSQIKYRKVAKEGLSVQKVLKKSRALKKYFVGSGKLKLICRPSAQMTISDIKTEIYNLQHYEDFTPDVILLDYIDILGVDRNSPKETRHKIDHDWKIARGIAQELSCLFVTASQSNRSGFKKDLDEEGVAEDVRKLAHVTHMVALNQSKEEKQKQIMRANVIVSRSEEFSMLDEAVCLYNYGIGQAFLDSKKKEEVDLEN